MAMFDDVLKKAENVIVETSQEILEGQRSEKWFNDRKGKWTGSRLKDLMSKGRGSALWGQTAKEYIFSRFMERLRDTYDTPIHPTWDMRRGIELEPYAIATFEKLYPHAIVEECDFMPFPNNPTAGASPDGLVKDAKTGQVLGCFETKSRGDKGTYSHAFERVHDKHPEFWQLQGEMIATGTDVCFYCHYSDLHEPPFDMQVQLVKRSEDHIIRLLERINEADSIIDTALDSVGDYTKLSPVELTKSIIEAKEFIYSR